MWDGALNPMQMMQTSGIYELFIPDVAPGAVYKYQILTRDGEILYKADPYGNQCQVRPDNANVVADLTGYKWKDTDWIENRKQQTRETELKSRWQFMSATSVRGRRKLRIQILDSIPTVSLQRCSAIM